MNKNPQFTPYKSTNDLVRLREWFFNNDIDNRAKAVAKVASYLTRGNLPHSIESTSQLTSLILNDEAGGFQDQLVLQLLYNMAIIKFVNGLLDPYQQSNFAIPLHTLANFLKLPSYFVEIRHYGTHEFLPSLSMLRSVTKKLLDWLYVNYWLEIDKLPLQVENGEMDEEALNKLNNDIKSHVKSYRRIRKMNLNKFYKFGDSTELGMAYWSSINNLRQIYDSYPDLFVDTLILKKILILETELTEGKSNGMKLLYRPLIEELGYDFCYRLLQRLVYYQNGKEFKSVEIDQSMRWCQYILSNEFKFNNGKVLMLTNENLLEIANIIRLANNKFNISLLEYMLQQEFLSQGIQKQILDMVTIMKKFHIEDIPFTIDTKRSTEVNELSTDLENLRKRMKLAKIPETKQDKQKIVVWEQCDNWEPTAFGVCI